MKDHLPAINHILHDITKITTALVELRQDLYDLVLEIEEDKNDQTADTDTHTKEAG